MIYGMGGTRVHVIYSRLVPVGEGCQALAAECISEHLDDELEDADDKLNEVLDAATYHMGEIPGKVNFGFFLGGGMEAGGSGWHSLGEGAG